MAGVVNHNPGVNHDPGPDPVAGGTQRRRVGVPWTVRDVLLAAGAALALFFAVILLIAVFQPDTPDGEKSWFDTGEIAGLPAQLAVAALLEIVFLGVALWFAVARRGAVVRQLGFVPAIGRSPYPLALLAWVGGLAASAAWVGLVRLAGIGWLEPPDTATDVLNYTGGGLVFPIIVVGIITPICEETFFRGFAMPALVQRTGSWAGITLSAVLFAAFHFSVGAFVPVFIFGMVLAWLYVRTGSIFPGMAAHAMQNIVALLLAN